MTATAQHLTEETTCTPREYAQYPEQAFSGKSGTEERALDEEPRFGGVFLPATDERYKVTTDDVPYIRSGEVAAQVGNASEK